MHSYFFRSLLGSLLAVFVLAGCGSVPDPVAAERVHVVTTTSILADAIREIGGDAVAVESLMGPGVDPHLFKATAGDLVRLQSADVVIFHGLHLEAKMADVLAEIRAPVVLAAAEQLPTSALITVAGGAHDPHVWFDVRLWRDIAQPIAAALAQADPAHAADFKARAADFAARLDSLDAEIRLLVDQVPAERRIIVTAHDAFSYFGRAYGFEVHGLQGVSTAAEAGIADVSRLADFIVERRVPALFVESSVSPRSIQAVQEAVRARGWNVAIGDQLYSDALGSPESEAATYIGMVRSNTRSIVQALAL